MDIPLAEIQMGAILHPSGEPLGTVAIPVRDFMDTTTVLSLMSTAWNDLPVDLRIVKGNMLTLQRNALVSRMRGDWILFIDGDMFWDPDAVAKIIASKDELEGMGHEVDVLGALCFRRGAPHQPTLFMGTNSHKGPYISLESWDDDFIEVDATGMAFALITKRCFERISGSPMPTYEERADQDRHPDFFRWQGAVGEDLRFCQDVKDAGGRIIVDTRIEIGHMSELRVTRKNHLLELANRSAEAWAASMKVNDGLGLPTVSQDAAHDKLRELYG